MQAICRQASQAIQLTRNIVGKFSFCFTVLWCIILDLDNVFYANTDNCVLGLCSYCVPNLIASCIHNFALNKIKWLFDRITLLDKWRPLPVPILFHAHTNRDCAIKSKKSIVMPFVPKFVYLGQYSSSRKPVAYDCMRRAYEEPGMVQFPQVSVIILNIPTLYYFVILCTVGIVHSIQLICSKRGLSSYRINSPVPPFY